MKAEEGERERGREGGREGGRERREGRDGGIAAQLCMCITKGLTGFFLHRRQGLTQLCYERILYQENSKTQSLPRNESLLLKSEDKSKSQMHFSMIILVCNGLLTMSAVLLLGSSSVDMISMCLLSFAMSSADF